MRILSLLILSLFALSFNQKTESPHGSDFKVACKTCHSPKSWQLDKEIYSFDHNSTRFRLVGQHAMINCRPCHTTLIFKEAKSDCAQCHKDIHQGTVGNDCSRCHTPASWLVNNVSEIHQISRFPLVGAHRTSDCVQCHKSESLARFDVPGINCIDCHRNDFLAATNPNHAQSGFPEDCSICHQLTSVLWSNSKFDHNVFSLDQAHSLVKCIDCHKTGNYSDAKSDCYSCHQQDYLATTTPDHNTSKFSTNCQNCHTVNPGWKPTTFNHSSFPLTLGHSTAACIDCHLNGNYSTTPTDCYACHQPNYTTTTNPNHISASIPTACATCHTTIPGWKPATYVHTTFLLTQGHSGKTCADCHKGNYTTTSSDCYSCHQSDYTGTTNPGHIAAGIPKTCATCHTTAPGWSPATFSHTAFPLTSGHAIPTCNDCHKGTYTKISTDCYSCHQPNYTSTTDPNHITAGIPTTCSTCHTTAPGWKPAKFSHTTFPLTSGHSIPTCNDCHKGNYTTTSTNCYSCHKTDYTATTNPNHTSAGIPNTCSTCHTTVPGWKPATFNHTIFPLTSGHSTPTCNDCHKGNYTTTSNNCYSCHQSDYTATTNPNHISGGIPNTCATCHTTLPGWKPATFTHTTFPLTLGHAGPTCNDCHKGNYTTTSTDCYSCHVTDYNNSTNPNHKSLTFSTTCTLCHTTIPGWKPAKYTQHDAQMFPIYSGKHNGQWNTCTDCHTNASNYAQFTCLSCHEHSKTTMDSAHSGRTGYSYVSSACYQCHPKGRSD